MTPAPSSPVALLDQLDELRAKATPGPWEPWTGIYGPVGADDPEGNIVLDYSTWVDNPHDAESARNLAALIVAAVNAVGPLTAAVRAVLELTYASDDGSEYEHEHPVHDGEPECPACWAQGIRTAVTAALSVTP